MHHRFSKEHLTVDLSDWHAEAKIGNLTEQPASLHELAVNVSTSDRLVRRDTGGILRIQRIAKLVGLAFASVIGLLAVQGLVAAFWTFWVPDFEDTDGQRAAYPWPSVLMKDVFRAGPTYRLNWRSGLQKACGERGMSPLKPTSSEISLFSFLVPATLQGKPTPRAIMERHNGVPPGCLGGKRALWIHLGANGLEDLSPTTFLNPAALRKALQLHAQVPPSMAAGLWFLKHSSMDRNEGVTCFKGARDLLNYWETSVPKAERLRYVAQAEVQRPLLLNERKLMLRAYVVTLPNGRCFLNRELLLKCHPRPYDPETADPEVQIISCTQYEGVTAIRGTDWPEYHKVWPKICRMLKACLGPKAMVGGKALANSALPEPKRDFFGRVEDLIDWLRGKTKAGALLYNLIGVDIIVDQDLRCWLIEMNPGPQMGIDEKEGLASELRANVMEDLCALLVDPLLRMAQRASKSKTGRWASLSRTNFAPAALRGVQAKRRGFVELL